jgi:hypothetical protein
MRFKSVDLNLIWLLLKPFQRYLELLNIEFFT